MTKLLARGWSYRDAPSTDLPLIDSIKRREALLCFKRWRNDNMSSSRMRDAEIFFEYQY